MIGNQIHDSQDIRSGLLSQPLSLLLDQSQPFGLSLVACEVLSVKVCKMAGNELVSRRSVMPNFPKWCPECLGQRGMRSAVKVFNVNDKDDPDAVYMCINTECAWPFNQSNREDNPDVSAVTDDAGCEAKADEGSFKKEICSDEALPITNLGDSKVQTDIVPQGWYC